MVTNEWESRDSSSADSDSNTETEKEVNHIAYKYVYFVTNEVLGNGSSLVMYKHMQRKKSCPCTVAGMQCTCNCTCGTTIQENVHARIRLTLQATRACW